MSSMGKTKMNKKKGLIRLAILLVVLILVGVFAYNSAMAPVSKDDTVVNFTVKEGETAVDIAKNLKEAELLKSELAFKFVSKMEGKPIYAGTYELKKRYSVKEIVSILTSNEKESMSFSIMFPEGKNMRQIAKIVAERTTNSEEAFIEAAADKEFLADMMNKYWWLGNEILDPQVYYPLEGYLFPDTYIFENKSVDAYTILATMLAQTDRILTAEKATVQASSLSVHEIMTMASLVELEGLDHTSRKDVASVFYNRLAAGMSLGSDVTTYYGARIDLSERDLTKAELADNNPYNTRGSGVTGLPIGPIANPGKEAILSVLYPNKTDYLYFVSDKNRKLYFSKTLGEHEKIVKDLKDKGLWFTY